ncbi:glycosyltransferase [Alkalihalobacillus sp. BA299]|uniref:glycosyltransferase n=1 Tax=Alkalihalobacillus sp. BA299 TaxID=2815938 RepID=UPI001ADC514B|nr:glycosyltransferase [Alkalihalobacillus sp. BA299]
MKENILFVMPSLSAGGGEKSLVNLLSQIDYNRFNIDLFLFNHNGIFMEYLPSEVNVLSLPDTYTDFTLPLHKSIAKFIMKRKFNLVLSRITYTKMNRSSKSTSINEQYSWKYMAQSLEKLEKKYDIAIGFLEKTSTYFCVDKVEANKKIGWVHIDYDKLGMDPQYDLPYFKKLDNIITVSEECSNILKERFPSEGEKVQVIYNIVSPTTITKMAKMEKVDNPQKNNEVNILSIGRLHYQKGFDRAIKACKIMVDKGYNIQWRIIGEGEERQKLMTLINEYNLKDHFHLIGLKSNPYPYIKNAEVYAQTSNFEGKSIAIDEAKILQKPILVTNFSTAKDQIQHGKNGLIVEMDPSAIADGIENLIIDKDLRKKLTTNLANEKLGTEAEINKLYELFAR